MLFRIIMHGITLLWIGLVISIIVLFSLSNHDLRAYVVNIYFEINTNLDSNFFHGRNNICNIMFNAV